ncbi:hypothetical protein IJ00_23050 [Calothrix sp. 336/3]|nr:hypothetical protein IJ00_23050 [Calothrix sp. 336/3]
MLGAESPWQTATNSRCEIIFPKLPKSIAIPGETAIASGVMEYRRIKTLIPQGNGGGVLTDYIS